MGQVFLIVLRFSRNSMFPLMFFAQFQSQQLTTSLHYTLIHSLFFVSCHYFYPIKQYKQAQRRIKCTFFIFSTFLYLQSSLFFFWSLAIIFIRLNNTNKHREELNAHFLFFQHSCTFRVHYFSTIYLLYIKCFFIMFRYLWSSSGR